MVSLELRNFRKIVSSELIARILNTPLFKKLSIQKCVSLSRQDFNLGKYAKKKSCFALSINCTDCYCNCLDRSTCNKAQQKVRWLGRGWREVTRKRTKTNEGEREDNAHTNIHPEKEQRTFYPSWNHWLKPRKVAPVIT